METIELEHREAGLGSGSGFASTDDLRPRASFSLPPTDTGLAAWLVLGSASLVEALAWDGVLGLKSLLTGILALSGIGFPFTFGFFESYYISHDLFKAQAAEVPTIGTTNIGIMYFSAPVLSWLVHRYPHQRRNLCILGLLVLTAGLLLASLCSSVKTLILTQGVLYGIGSGVLYFPPIHFIDEWFVRRKGLAYGIVWAGSGVSGIMMPFVVDWLLNAYGFRTALRVIAAAMVVLTTPLLFCLKPRIPPASQRVGSSADTSSTPRASSDGQDFAAPRARPLNLSFLATSAFWFFEVGNILINLGIFLPTIYIPSYVRKQHISSDPRTLGTASIALTNLAAAIGAVGTGALIDRLHVANVVLISALGTASSVLLLWGFAQSPAMLYVFSIAFGTFAGGFGATWSGYAWSIGQSMDRTAGQGAGANIDMGLLISMMAAGKGIGAIASGPLSSQLLRAARAWTGPGAYGTSFGGVVGFAGVSAVLGGLCWVGRVVGCIS